MSQCSYYYEFYLILTHSCSTLLYIVRWRWISVCPGATTRTVCRCQSWAATTPWPAAAVTSVMHTAACPGRRTTRRHRWPSAHLATWGHPCLLRPTTAVRRLIMRPLLTITIRRPSTDTIRTTTRTTNTTWTAQTPQVRTNLVFYCMILYLFVRIL